MKRFVFFLGSAVIAIIPAKAEAGWLHSFGGESYDAGKSVQQTSDGGYVVTGTTKSFGDTLGDIWLLKFDENGDTLWTKVFGDTAADEGYCVKQTADGGYILATSLGLIKTNENGVTQWTRSYPGRYVDLTSDGGYVAISDGPLLIKLDSTGDTLWTHEYDPATLNCVRQTSDGGYIMAGHYTEIGFANQGYWIDYAWFFKTDSAGNIIWGGARLGDNGTDMYTACETRDGGYVFGGNHEWDAASVTHLLLVKTNKTGDVLWQYTKDDNISDKMVFCVYPTSDSGVVITGGYWYTILKYDTQGEKKWERVFEFTGNCIYGTSDGGYITTGDGNGQLYLLKTDASGDTLGICEPVTLPSSPLTNIEIANPIGSQITLRYSNCANGFSASVFDASGRQVDELKSTSASGQVEWGRGFPEGVYFISTISSQSQIAKIVLIK